MTEQRFLGLVEIDSGMLLVADPSHVLPSADENKPGVDYSATLGATGHAQPIANGAALLLGSSAATARSRSSVTSSTAS